MKVQSFSKTWCNYFQVDQIKGRLVKRQLKMLGMVQKKTVSNHLKLNASDLEQVNSQKLVVVKIDCKLSFDAHIDVLCKKLSQPIAVLSRIKRFVPLKEWMAYYNAMIKATLYGYTVCSLCSLGVSSPGTSYARYP